MASSSSGKTNSNSEFILRLPKYNTKTFGVLRFDHAIANDSWPGLRMKRDLSNKRTVASDADDHPKSGLGSEFGKQVKLDRRKKMMGMKSAKLFKPDDQPWMLTFNDGRTFRAKKEAGISDNTSYYIFSQCPDRASFEAYPISAWYSASPGIRHRVLNDDEAEQQFKQRDKILNHFGIMVAKRLESREEGGAVGGMRIRDANESDESDNNGEDGFIEEKPKKSVAKKPTEEAEDEGDEVDMEAEEVDYISDYTSSDGEDIDEKLALKGVNEIIEEEDVEDESDEDKNPEGKPKEEEVKVESSSSGSESDLESQPNAFLMAARKPQGSYKPKSLSRSGSPRTVAPDRAKRKADEAATTSWSEKRVRPNSPPLEGITEESIRKYLLRKPITTKELLQKVKTKTALTKSEMVDKLAQVLKKMNVVKETINGRVYLSLKQ